VFLCWIVKTRNPIPSARRGCGCKVSHDHYRPVWHYQQDKAQDAGYTIEDGEAWISKDVDVLIPAALEGQINAESVNKISKNVKILAEAANGPTTPEADVVLEQNGVLSSLTSLQRWRCDSFVL
jgi:hypothetical protein